MIERGKFSDRLIVYLPLVAANFVVLLLLHSTWPRVGFDLCYFLPRLIDVHLHYLMNGVSLQWWTPSFGGGLPAFPNPQHTQFMPAQIFLPWCDPWTANVLGLILPLSLGYLLVVKFGLEYLAWRLETAVVAGLVFATNDFFLTHAFTGHVGFNSFPLVAALPFFLHARHRLLSATAWFAFVASGIVMSGGYTIIIVWWLTAFMLLPALSLTDREAFPVERGIRVMALGAVLMVFICAAKLCAISLFMQQFPRVVSYSHPAATFIAAGASVPAQLLAPKLIWILDYLNVLSKETATITLLGKDVDDIGLSPIAAVLVPVGFVVWIARLRRHQAMPTQLLGVVAVWITIEFTIGRGLLWPWLKQLPFLRSLHENSRFGAAFVLPISLFCGIGVQAGFEWLRTATRRMGFWVSLILVTLISMFSFRRTMHGYWFSTFDILETQAVWKKIGEGEHFIPIQGIADIRDERVFLQKVSNLKLYEPIFGYGFPGPEFHAQLKPGPTMPKAGPFNVTHPVALYSPSAAGLEPFSPIPETQAIEATQFLNRQQPPAWRLPPLQRIANWISGVTVATTMMFLTWSTVWRRPKHPHESIRSDPDRSSR